jgi:hypothetical protein
MLIAIQNPFTSYNWSISHRYIVPAMVEDLDAAAGDHFNVRFDNPIQGRRDKIRLVSGTLGTQIESLLH